MDVAIILFHAVMLGLALLHEIYVIRQLLKRLSSRVEQLEGEKELRSPVSDAVLSSRVEQLQGEKERLNYERAALAQALDVKEDASPPGAEPSRGRLGDMQNKEVTLYWQDRATSVSEEEFHPTSLVSVQTGSSFKLTPREAACQDVTRAPPPPLVWLPLFRRLKSPSSSP